MTNKHTPGPWFYRTHPNDFAFEHIASDAGAIVAKPMRMGGNGAMEANARLIAAAPTMLATLRSAEDQFAQMESTLRHDFDFMSALEDIRSVLAYIDKGD